MNTTAASRIALALALIAAVTAITATVALTANLAVMPQDGVTVPEIVKLERVVIVGKRAPAGAVQMAEQRIEKLPRVVITGRRAAADTQIAGSCAAQAVC